MQGLQGYWGSAQQTSGWGNKVYEQSEITNQMYAGQVNPPLGQSSLPPVGIQAPLAPQPGQLINPQGQHNLHGQVGQQGFQGEKR